MAERGNNKLNTIEHKIIAYKIPKYMQVMKLNYARSDKNYQAFLRDLGNCKVIDRIDPGLSTLEQIKPPKIKDQVVRVYVKKNIKQLDEKIKSIHLVTK